MAAMEEEKDIEWQIDDFDELFADKVVDSASIKLTEDDIDDPKIHVDIENLSTYTIEHLKQWLIYRGDQLHNIDTLKAAQVRVLQYFENGTNNDIIDPTAKKSLLRKKADKLGLTLSPFWKEGSLPSVPVELTDELNSTTDLAGWSKSLHGMPNFTVDNIQAYHEQISKLFVKKATAIKKHFIRGEQFIEERFLDLSNVYIKQSDEFFFVKGISSASLKKANRWMFLALSKSTSEILYSFCQCVVHAYALMKSLAKWVIDRISTVPQDKACTSKPCTWSVPQSKGRIDKVPLMEIQFTSPEAKRRKSSTDSTTTTKREGIISSLYETRVTGHSDGELCHLMNLINGPKNIPAPKLINCSPEVFRKTQFGTVPSGSMLSYQCPLMPPDFTVYCSLKPTKDIEQSFVIFPDFPFKMNLSKMSIFENEIHATEIKKCESILSA